MNVRQVPNSLIAEQNVLGGMMIDPSRIDLVMSIVKEADFFSKRHRFIFAAITELDATGEAVDSTTLGEWLTARGVDELTGGQHYLHQLANETPSASNVDAYARIVREKSVRRHMIEIGTRVATQAWEADNDHDEVVDGALRDLMALGQSSETFEMSIGAAVGEVIKDMMIAIENPGALQGLPTGLHDLDGVLGGYHNGDLILIPARPSMGKTAYLGCAVSIAARRGHSVGLISAEQPAKQIAARLMSAASRVAASKLRNCSLNEEEHARLNAQTPIIMQLPIRIFDRSAPTMTELARVARRWKAEQKIKALYVDYAQRIEGEGKDRYAKVSDVARGLKSIARDLNIPVIALAQVNRSVEQRADKRPGMSDIADSGELEKEADVVITMYRDEYYNAGSENKGICEFIVEKNRHGPTGVVRTGWNQSYMNFYDLANGRERQSVEEWERNTWQPQ